MKEGDNLEMLSHFYIVIFTVAMKEWQNPLVKSSEEKEEEKVDKDYIKWIYIAFTTELFSV